MNNETLNQVFSNTANSIRVKSGTSASITPINFANSILNIPSPNGIFKVTSIQERDELTPNEGDICLVHGYSFNPVNATSSFKTFTWNTNITLDEALPSEDMIMCDFQASSEQEYPRVQFCFESMESRYEIYASVRIENPEEPWEDPTYKYATITYTTSDRIHFTLSSATGDLIENNSITLPEKVQCIYKPSFNDCISKFLSVETADFSGVYSYEDSHWNYLDIGILTEPISIFTGNSAYTSTGIVNGSFFGSDCYNSTRTIINLVDDMPNYTQNLTNAVSLFSGKNSCELLNYINTSNVTDMWGMFYTFKGNNIPNFDTSSCTRTASMFSMCNNLTTIPAINTHNVTDMSSMFMYSGIVSVPTLDCTSCTSIYSMCSQAPNITSISLTNTQNISNMHWAFWGCSNLTTISLPNAHNAVDMSSMFLRCTKLSNASVNNILGMCATVGNNYRLPKTLSNLGFYSSNYPASTIKSLSNYTAFTSAGWTIGY